MLPPIVRLRTTFCESEFEYSVAMVSSIVVIPIVNGIAFVIITNLQIQPGWLFVCAVVDTGCSIWTIRLFIRPLFSLALGQYRSDMANQEMKTGRVESTSSRSPQSVDMPSFCKSARKDANMRALLCTITRYVTLRYLTILH